MLIIGMFVSFTAAMVAMLFFTKTVKNPEELQKIISGQVDKTRLSDEFTDPEQKLEALIELGQQYRDHYETQLKDAQELRDSLVTVEGKLKDRTRRPSPLRPLVSPEQKI